ncbi:MAG: alpha/beta fold hydrolase [Clostridiales bacterium]|nr:alpha/beta fold hydrolase [Clostridiales bacterium]
MPTERVEDLRILSVQLTEYLNVGDIDAAMAMMDEAMTAAMAGKLAETWTQLTDSAGSFIETGAYIGMPAGAYDVLEMTLAFENANLVQRVAFDSDSRISGLHYRNGEVEGASADGALPDGITEISVTIDAGDGYPLAGMLTRPKDIEPYAAIVFIHGSGPNDMNETIGANSPFRDLAYSLAERGIAVLRYDKRTYTHGAAIAESGGSITINEEVAVDALAAVKLIKSWDGIEGRKVYLLGHSMGGGMLSYINSFGADCAGYIIMAGTPRDIWELSAAQNLMLADEMEQSGDSASANEIRDLVKQETLKASGLAGLSSEKAVFGMPVEYLRELERIDAVALNLNDGLPVLILQGEKDRQVSMADFALWQAGLANHPDATYISYTTLNHLFGEYADDPVPFSRLLSTRSAPPFQTM